MRTIESPGVEINEIDLSFNTHSSIESICVFRTKSGNITLS